MLDAVYAAWQRDRDAGLATLMIAGNGEMVAQLNVRARADLIAAGKVDAEGMGLHDGSFAGVGDLVITRRNDRRLITGRAWVKNGDRWQVIRRYEDGSLAVRRVGRGDAPRGATLTLPAAYVREDLELGYASSVHRAQGASVDTGHALIDPETASRELLYVAMTRGKHSNHAYVIQPDPHELEAHLDPPGEKTATEQLSRVLARSDVDLSATETIAAEADRHASLSTLLDEYDVLSRDAQSARWEKLLDVAPFPDGLADDVFTSPHYEQLERALARHEASGRTATAALTALAPRLAPAADDHDPAAQLAQLLDEATNQLPRRWNARPRVASLIPTPAGYFTDDVRKALDDRRKLIEAAALRLAMDAEGACPSWLTPLGRPSADHAARTAWLAEIATVALYRYRYDINDHTPLGVIANVRSADQLAELRAAQLAITRARALSRGPVGVGLQRRQRPPATSERRLQ